MEIEDKPLLDFSDKWMTAYKNTQDPLYPVSYCIGDDGINITNCTLDWLEDEINPYPEKSGSSDTGTCYDFWDYCREKLNTDSPDWKYPVPYCENNSSLTCLEDWLNYETYADWRGAGNSPTNDETCKDFFDYCRAELIDTHPRYSYPLPAPPTVDDYMPGYCCFDTPLDTNTDTKFWGSHVSANFIQALYFFFGVFNLIFDLLCSLSLFLVYGRTFFSWDGVSQQRILVHGTIT